jgi:DNA replication protein DnaC
MAKAKDLGLVAVEKVFDWDVERRRFRCVCGEEFTALALPWVRDQQHECSTCEAKSAAQIEAARRASSVEAEVAAEIPQRYRWATLDSPDLVRRVESRQAIAAARLAMDAASMVVLGPAGSGKTSLACAILRARAAKFGKATGTYATAFALTKARQEHRLGDGEAPRVALAMSCRLLLIDELGAELGRNTAVPEVIHARHEAELPTMYTSGFSLDELAAKYGSGICRRLFEGATVIRTGRREERAEQPHGAPGVGYQDAATRRAGGE